MKRTNLAPSPLSRLNPDPPSYEDSRGLAADLKRAERAVRRILIAAAAAVVLAWGADALTATATPAATGTMERTAAIDFASWLEAPALPGMGR